MYAVVVALRRDWYAHFQQDAGLRLFMQNSSQDSQKAGRQDRMEEKQIGTTVSNTTAKHLPCPTLTKQEVGGGKY